MGRFSLDFLYILSLSPPKYGFVFVSFFPQMKPEASSAKVPVLSNQQEYLALGVPAEWIEPLQKLGYTTINKLKEVEKPGKLANDLNGYKKKNKLDLPGLSPEIVGEWIED